ncbi:MAG: type II toxin-antitoxin system VapB family antitoxin [Methylococcales bacterium]|nr:type II toxin-antitoxin system VapB family antitoxin [Methylococcales bacterium]
MKATISLDNAVLEQLLAYTQAKTTKESIAKAIEEYIRFKQRQELLSCRGSVEIENNWQQLRDLERPS